MTLYDQLNAEREIREMPLSAKAELSHIVRNGLMNVLSAYRLGHDVEKVIEKIEERLKKVGL